MKNYEKYQQLFLKNISKRLAEWHEQDAIEEKDIYQLLHTIKGTAASIGLEDLSNEAESMMGSIRPDATNRWDEEAWSELFQPILLNVDFGSGELLHQEATSSAGQPVQEQPTILILEDDLDFLHYFRENMESYGYNVLMATTEERALTLFYDEKPDLFIIDYYLQGKNGLDIVGEIGTQANSILTPIIVISADHSKELAKRVYETTAIDFIPKPIDFEMMNVIIRNRLLHVYSLKKQITTDKLTKTYNRTYLYELLDRKKKSYKREPEPFCLAILDLDDFKQVNDTYGHVVGDQVLRNLSEVLHTKTRPEDVVVRYGGEEFIVVMPNIHKELAQVRLQEVLDHFKQVTHASDNDSFTLSFTTGIAEMDADIKKMEDLIVQADTALYQGKRSGKGVVVNYEDGLELSDILQMDKRVHISIVDDDQTIREMLQDRLSELSFYETNARVETYEDGESFLEETHTTKYKHVVLLDGILPGKDGLDVLDELREKDQETIVIMLTGRQQGDDIIRALDLGADDYMTKPFSMDELVARIRRIVRRHKGGRKG